MEEKDPKKLQEEILNLEKEDIPKKNIDKDIDAGEEVVQEIEKIEENQIIKEEAVTEKAEQNIKKEINIEEGQDIKQGIAPEIGRVEKKQDIGLIDKTINQEAEAKKEMEEEREQGEEKMEFLRREDIKTMKKDIRKLRESEAGKEGSKISLLGKRKKQPETEEVPTEEGAINQAPIMPKFSKKTSSSSKVLIRLAFVFITILIGGGAYWFFSTQEKIVIDVEPETEKVEEINIPEAFATIPSIFSFDLEKKQKIIPAMEVFDHENLTQDELTRLIIKNSEKQLVPLNIIEKLFGTELSPEILEKIEQENFNLLALRKGDEIKKSLIIKTTAKISNPDLGWEKLIEKELVSSGEEEEETSIFEDFKSENRDIRCLANSSDYQLNLCYTTISDYFVISESFEIMQKTLVGLNDVTRKRIGQLFIVGVEGTTATSEIRTFFEKYYPGGVLLLSKNILSSHQIIKLNDGLQTISLQTTEQPLLIAIDQEGGPISRIDFLDELTAQSEIEESNNAYRIGLKRGEELKELGINLNFSPLMDNTGENDFLYSRSFQKDPEIAGELGKSLILGQREAGILSAVKHFPGYVKMTTNPEEKLLTVTSLPIITQFEEVMKVKPAFVMTANAIYEDLDYSAPFSFSEIAIDYLKDTLGKRVLVISDDLSQNSLLNNRTLKEIVSRPINAGVDLEIISGYRSSVSEALDAFLNAVNNQEISLEKIDTAVSRIIQLKKEL